MKSALFPFLLVAAYSCELHCLDGCFSSNSEADCLSLCHCSHFPYSVTSFGGNVTTEDGSVFTVQTVPDSERDYVNEVYDCKLKCGQLCFRFTTGWNLIKCVEFCGCGMFVSEVSVQRQQWRVAPAATQETSEQSLSPCHSACLSTCSDDACRQRCASTVCSSSSSQVALMLAAPLLLLPCLCVFLGRRKTGAEITYID